MIAHHRYLLAVAIVATLTNLVITNGDNLLFRVLQESLQQTVATRGIAGADAIRTFVREGTTAFYGDYFFWVNVFALLPQALLASRLVRYGGVGAVLLLLPVISLLAYTTMALQSVFAVVLENNLSGTTDPAAAFGASFWWPLAIAALAVEPALMLPAPKGDH